MGVNWNRDPNPAPTVSFKSNMTFSILQSNLASASKLIQKITQITDITLKKIETFQSKSASKSDLNLKVTSKFAYDSNPDFSYITSTDYRGF